MTLEVAADPRLNAHQRALIGHDYGMSNECLSITTRAALASYVLQLLRLDDADHRTPEAQQIVLTNRDALSGWLMPATRWVLSRHYDPITLYQCLLRTASDV